MLANCTSERYAVNRSRMLRLADYSRISFAALRKETGIEYDERMLGTLQLSRTQAQLDASAKDVKALAAYGIPDEVLDRDGGVRAEPALAHVRDKIVGGLLMPKDETGHFKFTNALAKRAEQLRVRFCLGTEVKRLDVEGSQVRGVVTNWERMLVIKQPIGVVGAITPWNFRASLVARKISPALAAGCTVILKPAEQTPLVAGAMFALAKLAGFPDGVINLVNASVVTRLAGNCAPIRKCERSASLDRPK